MDDTMTLATMAHKTDVISDIKGTWTNFKKHVSLEIGYFHDRAVDVLMEIDSLTRTEAEAKYRLVCRSSDKKKDKKAYKAVFVPAVSRVAEVGYIARDLSLKDCIKDGAERLLTDMKEHGSRVIMVGSSIPSSTLASLATVGLDKFVDEAYQSSEVGSKTDSTAFQTIKNREGLDLNRCLYMDDKLDQAEAAAQTGVGTSIWVLDGKERQETRHGVCVAKDLSDVHHIYAMEVYG